MDTVLNILDLRVTSQLSVRSNEIKNDRPVVIIDRD